MYTILNLFGRSPFAPLQSHMEKVSECVEKLPLLFKAMENKDYEQIQKLAEDISEAEHQADLTKNDIRNHLPKSLYIAMDRGQLLEILALQDSIADKAQDIAVLCTLKPLEIIETFQVDLYRFLNKNIEAYKGAQAIMKELHELLESSFGGIEAEKVKGMVEGVAFKEHEADIIQRDLLKRLFQTEDQMKPSTFYIWLKIFESINSIANLSEKLANRVRMTLELK